jgi:predicted ester cyclase
MGGKTMSTLAVSIQEQNKTTLRRLFDEAFNKGNLAVVEEIIAPNWGYHGPSGMELKGPEGFKQFITMYRTAFPDLHITITDMIAEGDKVATIGRYQGTFKGNFMGSAPTGKSVSGTVMALSRLAGGKEVEVVEILDMLSFCQQAGIVPPMGKG